MLHFNFFYDKFLSLEHNALNFILSILQSVFKILIEIKKLK